MVKIAPSLLAADFRNLEKEILKVEKGGADWIHLDVMDGHYVPNLTFGPLIVGAVRRCTKLPLDVHLMIEKPERYIQKFREMGADIITVHQEVCPDIRKTIKMIKDCGSKAGLSVNPATPVRLLKDFISEIDLILIMTVEPGFGGQSFIKKTITKIIETKKMIGQIKKNVYLEVDGGIDTSTASSVIEAGANVLVAGTAIFKADSVKKAIFSLRNAVKK